MSKTDELSMPSSLPSNIDIDIVKSWRSFSNLFKDAQRIKAITFCDSPEILRDFFESNDIEEMEVVVGDIDDYRENLTGNQDLADELERLKSEDKLKIYTCPNKQVHSKLNIVEKADGEVEIYIGSANLTKTGWSGRQTNCGVFITTDAESDIYDEVLEKYEEHRDSYGELFLDDLTEEIEATDDPREEIVELYVEGRVQKTDELQEVHTKLNEKALLNEGSPNEEIVQSLKNFDDKESIKERFSDFDVSASNDKLRLSREAYSEYTQKKNRVPVMRIKDDEGVFLLSSGSRYRLTSPPPEDSEEIDAALQNIEDFFATVEKYGESKRMASTKSHMFEALLYYFWAPFVNQYAEKLRANDLNLNKNIPYLYIYGEPNSGKGTFAEFVLSLLSKNTVTDPVDADEAGVRRIRRTRHTDTCFPIIIDDIGQDKLNNLDPLRNFWSKWSGDVNYPAITFISNDKKPKEWFRNRAKTLHFDVRFTRRKKGEAEAKEVISQQNPIFEWFSHLYLERDADSLHDDDLKVAREVFLELYELADRPLPDYFPEKPAEEIHDVGRRRWRQAKSQDKFTLEEDDGKVFVDFDEDVEYWEVQRFCRDVPMEMRAKQTGTEVVIRNPEDFWEWIGEERNSGALSKVKSIIGRES